MPAKINKNLVTPLSPMRSFRVRYHGGIVMPTAHECNLFFHSHYGILILLILLICNFSYINALAASPTAFEGRNEPARSAIESIPRENFDHAYQNEVALLLNDYLHQRSLFARSLSEGADIGNATHTWLLHIVRMRESLFLMKLPHRMKDFHLGFIYLLTQDERVANSMRVAGVTSSHENDFLEIEASLSAFIRSSSDILLSVDIK